jgi:signal transduction histidine kinase
LVIILTSRIKLYRWYHSLRWKLFFSFSIVAFFPILLFFNTILASVQTYYKEDRKNKLLTSANIVAGNITQKKYLTDGRIIALNVDEELDSKSKEGSYRILVFDDNLRVIKDTNKTEIGKTILVSEVINALENEDIVAIRNNERVVYASASITNDNSVKIGAVLLISSIEDIYLEMSDIQGKLIFFTIITIIALSVLVFFLSEYLISPLKNVLKTVKKMSEGHLNQRILVKGHDEFSALGNAFNDMTQKLEQVEKTREEFVSNVSHELKTPLSSIKVLTESILLEKNVPTEMYVEFLGDINSEIDRMAYIVSDLLTLVKLDQRDIAFTLKETHINKVVEDVLKRIYPLSEQKNIELLYEPIKNISIDADEMKLSLAISNLVENGIKYTPDGGIVKVIIDSDHQNVFITVQDTGIGIEEQHQKLIFNRFYRVDKARNRETGGTGLGLAITHSTVLLHNGSIKITSKENEGTTFVVRIPIHN